MIVIVFQSSNCRSVLSVRLGKNEVFSVASGNVCALDGIMFVFVMEYQLISSK